MNFVFRGDELLVDESSSTLPDDGIFHTADLAADQAQALWLKPGKPGRTAFVDRSLEAPVGYAFKKLRSLFGVLNDADMALAGRAFQIAEWSRTHRYCGACASATERSSTEFCMRCPQCGLSAYPRISPAMMVLIKKGDQILLAKHTGSPTARHTALAGFVEVGESIEQTVHREVFEEVGLRVHDLQYFGSQPWPFPHSLMVAYTAEYLSGEITVQEDEIAEARWYGPQDALPEIAGRMSIAGLLIRANLPGGASER